MNLFGKIIFASLLASNGFSGFAQDQAKESSTMLFGRYATDSYVYLDTEYIEAPDLAKELLDKAKTQTPFLFLCAAKDAHECFNAMHPGPSKDHAVMRIQTVHIGTPDAIPNLIDRFSRECLPPNKVSSCQLMEPLAPFSVQSLSHFPPGAKKALWTRVTYSTWTIGHSLTLCYSECTDREIREINFKDAILKIARVKSVN